MNMRTIFSFIVNYPFIFLIIFFVIYTFITYGLLKNKIKEIEKTYKPIDEFILKKLDQIINLINQLLLKYQDDDQVTSELTRILQSTQAAKTATTDIRIQTVNEINDFVLNTALLRTEEYPELQVLRSLEFFGVPQTQEENEMLARRQKFNELVVDYNHDILNPPNSIIVKLFGLRAHFPVLENNEGKTPRVATTNTVKLEQPLVEEEKTAEGTNETTKKVCPNCHTEFTSSSKFCPTCGNIVQ